MHATVIDANVFHAFFYETFEGKPHGERTGSALQIFGTLGNKLVAFLDTGKIIESEWRQVCVGASEWFNAWLEDSLIQGHIFEVESSTDKNLSKRYCAAGFPRGRDICYVRVAHGLTQICKRTNPWLVAEDIDFFDPTKKAAGKKAAVLKAGQGPIAKLLRDDGIRVACIKTFSDHIAAQ
jgi:hypothetical protein